MAAPARPAFVAALEATALVVAVAAVPVAAAVAPSIGHAPTGRRCRGHAFLFSGRSLGRASVAAHFFTRRVVPYIEALVGRWQDDDGKGRSSAFVTQLGFTPVLRCYPHASRRPVFLEAGVGVNVVTPIYCSNNDKCFSTAFNFGDHLAVGWRFADAGRHEVALRLQHFSNAGIAHPNPGESLFQLRYSRRFDP